MSVPIRVDIGRFYAEIILYVVTLFKVKTYRLIYHLYLFKIGQPHGCPAFFILYLFSVERRSPLFWRHYNFSNLSFCSFPTDYSHNNLLLLHPPFSFSKPLPPAISELLLWQGLQGSTVLPRLYPSYFFFAALGLAERFGFDAGVSIPMRRLVLSFSTDRVISIIISFN